jgi:hypothetical protein
MQKKQVFFIFFHFFANFLGVPRGLLASRRHRTSEALTTHRLNIRRPVNLPSLIKR